MQHYRGRKSFMSDDDARMLPYELRFALPYLALMLAFHLLTSNPSYRLLWSYLALLVSATYAVNRFSADRLRAFRAPEFWQIWGLSAAVVALVQMHLGAENHIRASQFSTWLSSPLIAIPLQGLLLAVLYAKGPMSRLAQLHKNRSQARTP